MQRGLRLTDGWPKWVSTLLLLSMGVACDEKESPQVSQTPEERELLDPVEPTRDRAHRCKPSPGSKPVTLRAASSKDGPGTVEAGTATSIPGGFVVGVLRTAGDSYAELAYFDGRGASKVTRLGRVHGAVDAPRVASFGSDALVAIPDNDAGHTRVRLAKVKSPANDAEVSWGPEIQVRRGESQSFSLASGASIDGKGPARAVLVWDDFDKASLRSQIRALSFDPATMKAEGPERALTAAEEDASDPMILQNPAGSPPYWMVWLAYQPRQVDPSVASGALIEEPPRTLRVQKLDEQARPEGQPLTVSDAAGNVLVFDATTVEGGGVAIAYRETEGGRSEGAAPVQVRLVDPSGAIASQTVAHDELGLGAPALMGSGEPRSLWLSARAAESDILLGHLGQGAVVEQFALEEGLSERIMLAGSPKGLLVMEPDGLDLRFSTVDCRPTSLAGDSAPRR